MASSTALTPTTSGTGPALPAAAQDVLTDVAALASSRASSENFPVASKVLPAPARRDLMAVYRYARFVDDLGDGERGGPAGACARLDALAAVAQDVQRLPEARLDVVAGLSALVAARPEARQALLDLITANRVDQEVSRYESFDDLLGYCHLSAAPVGRLVLAIAGVTSPSARAASDDVCNGLQILEHCQDVGEDARRGRIYLPLADLRAAGVEESATLAAHTSPALRGVVAQQVARARDLLASGHPLLADLHGWARIAVAGYVGGGLATAVALERGDFAVLESLLSPSRRRTATEAARLLAGAVRGPR